eukprot:g21489.t1
MARVRVGPIRDSGGNLCAESEEVGEAPEEYFTMFTSDRDFDICEDSVKQADMLKQVDVRKEDVLDILKNMRIDLDEEMEVWGSMFADDMKVGGVVDSVEGCRRLQWNIDRMQNWAKKWQMEFNPEKCE